MVSTTEACGLKREVMLTTLGQKGEKPLGAEGRISLKIQLVCVGLQRSTYREEEHRFGVRRRGQRQESWVDVTLQGWRLWGKNLGNTRSHSWRGAWPTGCE